MNNMGVDLKINDNYKIVSDSRQFTLKEKYVNKSKKSKNYGEVGWKKVKEGSSFRSIDKLLEFYYRYRPLTSDIKEWPELIILLKEIRNEIAKIREEIEYAQ